MEEISSINFIYMHCIFNILIIQILLKMQCKKHLQLA